MILCVPQNNLRHTKITAVSKQHWPENYRTIREHKKLRSLYPPLFNIQLRP